MSKYFICVAATDSKKGSAKILKKEERLFEGTDKEVKSRADQIRQILFGEYKNTYIIIKELC